MHDPRTNQILNQALIRVYRSLLQYAAECWPWASANAQAEQATITEMGLRQQSTVRNLVELLTHRGWPIEFSNYPNGYTDHHYVGLDFLLGEIIKDEEELIADLQGDEAQLASDPEGAKLIAHVLDAERSHLVKLRELAAATPAAA